MRICTSIGISRTERQQKCVNSWLGLGCTVTAIQSKGESKILSKLYPEVEFVETNLVGDIFHRNRLVRISAIVAQAVTDPVLILNSDIEVKSTKDRFRKTWSHDGSRKLKMGIRWEHDGTELKLLKYGIDAFLITPEMVGDLNDIGMVMGCPAWDYWIPIHLQRKGYALETSKLKDLIHEVHPQNWTKEDFSIGVSLLRKHYGLDIKAASKFILNVTEREDL